MNDLLQFVVDEVTEQAQALDGEPVVAVLMVFDANGRAAAATGTLPAFLPNLIDRLPEAAADIRNDLAAQLHELHLSAERLAAEAINQARH